MTYTQTKECIKDVGRDSLEDLLKYPGEEVIEAALSLDISPGDIEEAYQGQYKNDEDFTQSLLEDTGSIPSDLPGFLHIDWEWTAKEIMYGYCESCGHYFRNL